MIECCGCPAMDRGPSFLRHGSRLCGIRRCPTLSWFLCSTFSSNLCFILAENAQSELLMWKMWVYFYLFRVLRVAVCRDVVRRNLPPRPFKASLPYMVVASCRLQAATLSAMQPDLFLSPALQCLGLLSLALPERKIFISPSSWSPVKTRFRSRPAIKTRTKGRVKAKDVFTLWSICSRTNRTGRCC